jgi:hypothetical protein
MKNIWWERMEAPLKIVGKGTAVKSPCAGLPDIMICFRGRLIAIELKRSRGGCLSGAQAGKLCGIQDAGGRAAIVRSGAGLTALLAEKSAESKMITVHGSIDVY